MRAEIDGILVQDLDLASEPKLEHRLRLGFIGFPDMGGAYSLRNITVEDLGPGAPYTDLFDGRTLEGWELRGGGKWSVRDGVIVGANGHGVLYGPVRIAGDFEFTALVRTHDRVNGGVFFRGSPDPKLSRGFEIQIYSPVDAVYPTGSIYGIERAGTAAEYEGQWFVMQVIARGKRCTVRLNGETVAASDRIPTGAGRIGLQIHSDNARVEFRDLRVWK